MSPVYDVLLGGAITFVTRDGELASTCGQACGFAVGLGAAVDLIGLLAANKHPCPEADVVLGEILARRYGTPEPELAGAELVSVHQGRRTTDG